MTKLKSNSAWGALSVEQRGMVELWLFEKNLSYKRVLELVTTEFGVKTSLTSLKMFGRRLAAEREERIGRKEVLGWIEDQEDEQGKPVRSVTEKMAMMRMVEISAQGPGDGYEVAALCRAVTANRKMDFEMEKLRVAEERAKREAAQERELREISGGGAA